jgi:6-phosphogluconolactonase (cycloisomerase 2 family)
MCEHRCSAAWRFPIGFLIGWMLAVGWQGAVQVAVGADADGGFTLYAPSGSRQRLLVVRAKPSQDGVELSMARTVNLGFPGSTIAVHATRPVLYVSGGHGEHRHNAAVVPLDEAGLPQEPKPVTLDRGYAYLSTDRAGRFLLGCDYGSGTVDVYPLDAAGLPGKRVHGLDEGRKEAHCVLPSPDNRSVYIPYVKQNNALFQYAFDPATGGLTPLEPKDVGPPADSGPRHLVYHPRLPLVYFSEEQGLGISIYRRAEDGRLTLWQRSRAVPAEWKSPGLSSSDIVLTPDGRHLYAGIRGPDESTNVIACYALADDGGLAPRGVVPADKTPWGMAASPDGKFLAVTGFGSATLMLYAIAADGSLTRAATLPWDERITDIVAR